MKKIYSEKRFLFTSAFLLVAFAAYAQTDIVFTMRTTPRGVVSFSSNVTLSGVGNGKFIDGYAKAYGNMQFTFPVGDNGVYRPFAASADLTTGAYYQENAGTASLPPGGPYSTEKKAHEVSEVSVKEFWDIDGTNATKITLTWNAASAISTLTGNSLNKLTIVGWNDEVDQWEKIESTMDATALLGGASTLSSGSITTNEAIIPDTYSVYGLAAKTSGALPVTLVSFKAHLDDQSQVVLEWSTTAETNSQEFEIERSQDGQNWSVKGTIVAKGESAELTNYTFLDKIPLKGSNLYRLKMIDNDATFSYSSIENINLIKESIIAFYPNPVVDRLFLKAENPVDVKNVTFYGLRGNEIFNAASVPSTGIDMKGIATGIYLVKVSMSDGSTTSQKIIVNN